MIINCCLSFTDTPWNMLQKVLVELLCLWNVQIVLLCNANEEDCTCPLLQLMFLLLELGRRMFSADNTGLIIVWKTSVSDSKQRPPCHRWCVEKVQDCTLLICQIRSLASTLQQLCSRNEMWNSACFLCRKLMKVTSTVSPSTCCSSIQTGGACSSMPKTASWGWWTWECKSAKTKLYYIYFSIIRNYRKQWTHPNIHL